MHRTGLEDCKETGARPRAALVSACAMVLAALAGCSNDTTVVACETNSDCKAGYQCSRGRCGCATNDVCPKGQICNAAGSCQEEVGCTTSMDCPTGTFCDTATGQCIDNSLCTADVQCELNEVCDTAQHACVSGCRENGDCQLGWVCQCPNSATSCAAMQCVQGPCADNSYCNYGQQCVTDPSGGPSRCETDTRGPFCQPCTYSPGSETACSGITPNFCLLDTTTTFNSEFCGVDCSNPATESCPWGFDCDDILILTQNPCGQGFGSCPLEPGDVCATNAQCVNGGQCIIPSGATSGTCQCITDKDCAGGTCDTSTGKCQPQCSINEGSVKGFCTCLQDSDCPTDTCGATGQCVISLKTCDPTAPDSCGPIFCKKVADPQSGALTGYCYIGANCAPWNGVTCAEVQAQQ